MKTGILLLLFAFISAKNMSGHSKWSTIKRQKAVTDSRRSAVFTKLGRLITVAAREGGKDPDMNFKLRLAIDKAKAANMPNDNIDRAIKSGAGELRGAVMKEVLYEGFGPGQVAVLVQALTDNSNRTAAEMRAIFHQHSGTLGSQNSVAWMFRLLGTIDIPLARVPSPAEAFELSMVDAGADDVREEGDRLVLTVDPSRLSDLQNQVRALGITDFSADTDMIPQTTTELAGADREELYALFEDLEDHLDVTNFFSNDA